MINTRVQNERFNVMMSQPCGIKSAWRQFFFFLVMVGRRQMMLLPHLLTGSITEAAYFLLLFMFLFILELEV